MKVQLGQKYRDTITGFEGTATARTEFLYGCVRIALEAAGKKNEALVDEWFDEQRLVHAATAAVPTPTARSGGVYDPPPRRDARRSADAG